MPAIIEALHAKVLAGDVAARAEICCAMLPDVQRRVCMARRSEDQHAIDTAAEDAVLVYLRAPHAYDPSRGGLMPWLAKIALNRLADFQRATRRRMAHEWAVGVDLSETAAAAPPAESWNQREDWIAAHMSVLAAAARTPSERRLIEARLAKAGHEVQAAALSIEDLPPAEARTMINRQWELLCRRARRLWRRQGNCDMSRA